MEYPELATLRDAAALARERQADGRLVSGGTAVVLDPRTVSLAWLRTLQEEERALPGEDLWGYGLDPSNHTMLDTFLGYAHAQGVAARRLAPEDLFHPATLDQLPGYV